MNVSMGEFDSFRNQEVQRTVNTGIQEGILTLAQGQLSQNAQTRTLIDALRPVAQPAYITCSPYESIYGAPRCGCASIQ